MIVILMIVIVITKDKVCCRKIIILNVVLNIFGIYVNDVVQCTPTSHYPIWSGHSSSPDSFYFYSFKSVKQIPLTIKTS